MNAPLTTADTEKLIALQELCDNCNEAIAHQGEGEIKIEMQQVCDKCRKVRLRVPELMELRQRLEAFNAEHGTNV